MTSTLDETPTLAPPPTGSDAPGRAGVWWGFAAVVCAGILNVLDSTIVNVAGPLIRLDLHLSTAGLEWVAAAYTLALAIGLMTGARLGDRYGRRRMFLIGTTGFVTASVLCATATSPATLIAARTLQGAAAAAVLPQAFGLIRELFPPAQVGRAFGVMGPVIGLSTVLGPVVAGLLTRADLFGSGWRALFLINVPLGGFALAMGVRHLPREAKGRADLRLDVGGTVLLAVASLLLVFPLVDGRTAGWPAWMFVLLAASLPAFGTFTVHQRARMAAGRHPLVEFSVLRKRSYVAGIVFMLLFFGTLVGFSLTVGLFLQIGLGFSALEAALYLAAMAVGSFVGAGVGSWAATAIGRPILHVGLSIMAAGVVVLDVSLHHASGYAVGFADLAPGLALFGLGMGMIFVPLFGIALGDVEEREIGSASGLLTSMEQLGASIGVAVLATVFFGRLHLEAGGPAAAVAAGRHLLAAEHTLLWVLGGVALAWLVAWLLPRRAAEVAH